MANIRRSGKREELDQLWNQINKVQADAAVAWQVIPTMINAISGIVQAIDDLTAKLDADAGVTDTDYNELTPEQPDYGMEGPPELVSEQITLVGP